jgi:hypothetical protein
MDTNRHESKLCRRAFVVTACALVVLVCGCTTSLRPYNLPSEHSLKILNQTPQNYFVRVEDKLSDTKNDYVVGTDGVVQFHVPRLPRGCDIYLFSLIKIDENRPEDVQAIQLIRDGRVVKKLSLNEVSRLPRNSDGVAQLQIK